MTVNGQNIQITFKGTGESTVVESVIATNLTLDESITLPGNETLILSIGAGIIDLNESHENPRLYPNPFQNYATLDFYQNQGEEVFFSIRNLIGQIVYQSNHYLESGEQSFMISLSGQGIYFIDISSKTQRRSIKAICTESVSGSASMVKIGSAAEDVNWVQSNRQKSQLNEYSLNFTLGDLIHYSCKSGDYNTIITDSPTVSKKYDVEFVGCTDTDGKNYSVVNIGDQTWMAENLAYLPAVSPFSEDSYTEKYYYVYDYNGTSISEAKALDNFVDHGVLYNWEAAISACSSGWHLPSAEEWLELVEYLDINGGQKLKSTTGWDNDGNGDNSSGFNGLASGNSTSNGGFDKLGAWAYFWSSSPDGEFNGVGRALSSDYNVVVTLHAGRKVGCSVRCIKD